MSRMLRRGGQKNGWKRDAWGGDGGTVEMQRWWQWGVKEGKNEHGWSESEMSKGEVEDSESDTEAADRIQHQHKRLIRDADISLKMYVCR